MRRPLVAGNWKMNGNSESIRVLLAGLENTLAEICQSVDVAVCPPHVYLDQVGRSLQDSEMILGAQDVSRHVEDGAYTGECSANMLKDIGCSMVIVGHSERRHGLGETNDWVAEKVVAARKAGLTPILCVGELLEERETGRMQSVIEGQLQAVIDLGMENFEGTVIAYEPVWAIGTGKTASPEQAQEVHAMIRAYLAGFSQGIAQDIRILYGGSVKPDNAGTLFAMQDIDGGLIGGASLSADDFTAICQAACQDG
ncbi:MAG: triose-phosphate isomerase [Gammaproteobacteria bacterium]|nr:MAG: triose-phosphate isomerase [Gammaproteobacteria bacterium]